MGKLAGNSEFAFELCKVLDVDPAKVLGITLEVRPSRLVSASIEIAIAYKQGEAIIQLLKKYAWKEDEEKK